MKSVIRSMFKSLTANRVSKARAPKKTRTTILRMESLEERQLLSVTNPLDDAVAAGPSPSPYLTAVAEETVAPIAFSLSTLEDAEAAPTEGEFAGKIWLQGVVGNVDVANAPVGFEIADVVVENMDDVGYIVTVDGEASDAFAVQDGALKVASPLEVGVYLDVVVTATDGTNAVSTTPFNFFVYSDADDVEIKQETVLVTGYVESSLRGEKVANAILSAEWTTANGETQSASTPTDENGFYTFRSIPAVADVALSLVSGAYDLSVATFDASAGRDIVGLNMRATPFGSVSGVLTDATGAPVAGVWVAVASGEDFYEMTKTDENGAYVVDGLRRDGEYVVSVEAAGAYLAVEPRTVSLSKNRTATVDFALSTGSALTGVVRDAAGEPLAGVELLIVDAAGTIVSATTDENGVYAFAGLTEGDASIYVASKAYINPGELKTTIGAENAAFDIELALGRGVSGVLRDAAGNVLAYSLVTLTDADGKFYSAITDENGNFVFEGLAEGEYVCEVYDGELNIVATVEITVEAANVEGLEIVVADENVTPASMVASSAVIEAAENAATTAAIGRSENFITKIKDFWHWITNLSLGMDDYNRQAEYFSEITAKLYSQSEKLRLLKGTNEYLRENHQPECEFKEQVEQYEQLIRDVTSNEQESAYRALQRLQAKSSSEIKKEWKDLCWDFVGICFDGLVYLLGPQAKVGISVAQLSLLALQYGPMLIELGTTDPFVKQLEEESKQLSNLCTQKNQEIFEIFGEIIDKIKGVKDIQSLGKAGLDLASQLEKLKNQIEELKDKFEDFAETTKKLAQFREDFEAIGTDGDIFRINYYLLVNNRGLSIDDVVRYLPGGEPVIDFELLGSDYTNFVQKQSKALKAACTHSEKIVTTIKWLQVPGLDIALDIVFLCNDIRSISHMSAELQACYKDCNDKMWKYRVAVDKIENFEISECQCIPDYELVLCIDTTASMTRIEDVKKDAVRFAQGVLDAALESSENRKYNSAKISIVLYRDYGDEYVTRYILGHSSSAHSVKWAINSITIDGGGDLEEAKNTAVMRCIKVLEGSSAHLKQIVIATDAPGHSVDHNSLTWEDVEDNLERNNITVSYLSGAAAYSAAVLDEKVAATVEATPASDYAVSNSIVDDLLDVIDQARFLPTIRLPEVVNGYTYAPIVFDASASYAAEGREIVQYEWDWNNDGVYDYVSNEPTVEYAYTYAYAGSVALRVTDDQGGQRSASAYAVVVDATDAAFLYANDRGTEDLIVCAYNVDDEITITPGSTEGTVRVAINGVELAVDEFAPTGAIVVKAYDGTNVVTIDGRVGRPVYVRGGNDEDALIYDDSANADATEYLLADGEICANDVAVVIFDGVESVAATTGLASDVVDVQASETTEFSVVGAPDAEGAVVLDTLNVLVDSTETGEFAFENEENTAGVWRAAEGSALQNVAFASTQTAEALEAASLAVPRLYVDNYDEGSASWTEVENALGYVLEYSVSPNFADYRTLFTTAAAYSLDMTNVFEGGFYVRAKAVGADFVDSAWSDAVFLSRPKVLNVPEWNLADYAGYDEFVLDATTDANVTATLYGKNADGELDVLKAWDFVGAEAVATIVGRTNVAESLTIAAGAATLLAEINFDGGDGRKDSVAIAGTDADDAFALGTESVETTTPVYQNNPYEKLLQRYADIYGENSPIYRRLKAVYDGALETLQKYVVVKTATNGVVGIENGAQIKFGGVGDVAINAGDGDDRFAVETLNFDYVFRGGEGNDVLDFAQVDGALNINMGSTARQAAVAGDGGTLRLVGDVESVVGTRKNDRFIGAGDGSSFVGNGGSDVVTILGGENNVDLRGARQSVVVRGGTANIAIADGDYSVVNVSGNARTGAFVAADGDRISIVAVGANVAANIDGDFASVLAGTAATAQINVVGSNASVITGAGDDFVAVVGNRATINVGAGDDTVRLAGAFSNVFLGYGDDFAEVADNDSGSVGSNTVMADAGDDAIVALNASGLNRFNAGLGNDVVLGGTGTDYIYGVAGNNVLIGGDGADYVYGGLGRDVLAGSQTSKLAEKLNEMGARALYGEIYENWVEDGDLDATIELLGEKVVADGDRDWIYRGAGIGNLVYASRRDGDVTNALEIFPFDDELRRD